MVYFHIFPNIKEILDIKIILQSLSCTKNREKIAPMKIFSLSVCVVIKNLCGGRAKKKRPSLNVNGPRAMIARTIYF